MIKKSKLDILQSSLICFTLKTIFLAFVTVLIQLFFCGFYWQIFADSQKRTVILLSQMVFSFVNFCVNEWCLVEVCANLLKFCGKLISTSSWKTISLYGKTVYYLKPFVVHLIDIWQQPLPFPTLFKIFYSCFLIILIVLPFAFPIFITISYYATIQYLLESALDIVYPKNLDIIHNLKALFSFETESEKHVEVLNIYIERCRYVTTVLASCIDYMRMGVALVTS